MRSSILSLSAGNTNRSVIDSMRLFITTFVGVVFGVFLGISYHELSSSKMNLPSSLFPTINLTFIEDKFSGLSPHAFLDTLLYMKNNIGVSYHQSYRHDVSKIWIPTNPHGAERLPSGIVVPESDLYLHRGLNLSSEDLAIKSKYLVTLTVGANQKNQIDSVVKKFSDNFTILLFHYDGRGSEWDDLEWSSRAIHVSVQKQTKWWYAKRFLHPDIVASFEYIFVWDEDLGVDNFDGEEYIRLVKKYNLQISQPGLDPTSNGLSWEMTKRKNNSEVHKLAHEKKGKCKHPHLPPCAAFVEIMAPVFSLGAWRCVWHMLQNDLVHGWGLDFALRKCIQPAHEKIGVVDSQWIVHQSIPSLGDQGMPESGREPWEGVRERCIKEWKLFHQRFLSAEITYYASIGIRISLPNSTTTAPPAESPGHFPPAESPGHFPPAYSTGHFPLADFTGHSPPAGSTGRFSLANATSHSPSPNSKGQ